MTKWQACCKDQNVVFSHEENAGEGKKRKVYECTNCGAQHSELFNTEGVKLKQNTAGIDPFNL